MDTTSSYLRGRIVNPNEKVRKETDCNKKKNGKVYAWNNINMIRNYDIRRTKVDDILEKVAKLEVSRPSDKQKDNRWMKRIIE